MIQNAKREAPISITPAWDSLPLVLWDRLEVLDVDAWALFGLERLQKSCVDEIHGLHPRIHCGISRCFCLGSVLLRPLRTGPTFFGDRFRGKAPRPLDVHFLAKGFIL